MITVKKKFRHKENPLKKNYRRVDAVTHDSGYRFYKLPDGSWAPSVTTVTGLKKSQFFKEWREKNPYEAQRTLNRGNIFHYLVENYLQNKNPEEYWTDEPGHDLLAVAEQFICDIDNIMCQENTLWSEKFGLAGRVDCVGDFQGKLSIIDFKASTRPKDEKDITNYFVQGAAYAMMFEERTGIPINQIVIIIACEDGTSQVFIQKPKEYMKQLLEDLEYFWKEFDKENNSG